MITPLGNPLVPLPSKGRPALRLVVSLVFAVSLTFTGLFFAASARAQGTNTTEGATEAPAGEVTPESGRPPEQTPPTTEQAPSTGEQAPPVVAEAPASTGEQAPPVVAEAPASTGEQAPPVVAEAPASTGEQTPPVVAEAPASTGEQTPPVVAEAPASTGEQSPPVVAEAPPAHEQEATEKQAGKAGGETSSEERVAEGTGDSQTPAGASGSDHKEPANEVVSPPSIAVTASGTATAMSAISMLAGEKGQASVTLGAPTTSAHQASRELATCGIAAGSVGLWLDMRETSSVSTIALAYASPAMIATGALARDRDGGLAIESHTPASAPGPTPGPGPAPGGAGGGSAAGGAPGAASSASSVLVNALLQAAPNVMLRLCVSQPSLRTSFFALFPERPG